MVEAVAREGKGISIRSGIDKLLVLKSTGSAFYGFHRDEYTRLPETWDRILSTEVECGWTWKPFPSLADVRALAPKFDAAHEAARNTTLDIFAKDNSASVQATMYKMCDQILAQVPDVEKVDYSLPNKHYFEVGTYSTSHSSSSLPFSTRTGPLNRRQSPTSPVQRANSNLQT